MRAWPRADAHLCKLSASRLDLHTGRHAFNVSHYRSKDHPQAVQILHPKTGEEAWFPLFDDAGKPLYPELILELDAIKCERIGGLLCSVSHSP